MQFSLEDFENNSKTRSMSIRKAVKLANSKYAKDDAVQFFLRAYMNGLPAVKLKGKEKIEASKAKTKWAKKNLIKAVRIREERLIYRR